MEDNDFRKNRYSVLIADDDPDVRSCVRFILERSGYDVYEASDGAEAVTKYSENKDKIDLLLFDVSMPKKCGPEALNDIQKISPGVKALFMSGNTYDLMPANKISEEGFKFIAKPILPADLLKKIREVLV